MDELTEQALAGGRQTHGIVRVGQTVRRSLHQRSDYVHALLRHLEAVGFDAAPRLLGIDAQDHAVWCCADVAEWAVPVAEQARKLRRMCDAHGWADVDLVVQEIGDRFRRSRPPCQGWSGEGRGHLRQEGRLDGSERGGAGPACYASGFLIALTDVAVAHHRLGPSSSARAEGGLAPAPRP